MGRFIRPRLSNKHRALNTKLARRGRQREKFEVEWMAMTVGTTSMVSLIIIRSQALDLPILHNTCRHLHMLSNDMRNHLQERTPQGHR